MRRMPSSWTPAVHLVLLCGLASFLLRPASAGEPRGTPGTRVAPPGILAGCGRADPFAPLAPKGPPSPPDLEKATTPQGTPDPGAGLTPPSLRGIIWSRTLSLAIIDDALVGVGDSVAGRKVVRIDQDEVVVEINAKIESLRFTPPRLSLRIERSRPKE